MTWKGIMVVVRVVFVLIMLVMIYAVLADRFGLPAPDFMAPPAMPWER